METKYQWGVTSSAREGWNKCASRKEAEDLVNCDIDLETYDAVICLRRVPLSELIGKYAADLVEDPRLAVGDLAGDGDYEYFDSGDCDPVEDLDDDAASLVRNAGVQAMMAQADAMGLWSNVYKLVPPEKWPAA